MLFLDGVYLKPSEKTDLCFKKAESFKAEEIQLLVENISKRVLGYLERHGVIERDIEQSYLSGDLLDDEDSLLDLQNHSITYRIAVGPQKGKKVLTLKMVAAEPEKTNRKALLGQVEGFSLHAGVAAGRRDRKKLERLCRYIARPAVSVHRLSLTSNGKVRYELKTAYRDGTTHVIFEPLDFISRLAALVPKPRVNLTRFHGVFAPNNKYRGQITLRPAKKTKKKDQAKSETGSSKKYKMTWAQRLKRVFDIEVSICTHCGGHVKIIACIEDRATIDKILDHIKKKELEEIAGQSQPRAPPQTDLFGQK